MTLAAVVLAVALVAHALLSRAAVRELSRQTERCADWLEDIAKGPEASFSHRLLELETMVDTLPQRWEQIKAEATRAEGRARAVVRDAQKQLAQSGVEHAGLEAQASELRVVDGGAGAGEPVPAVREGVEGARPGAEDWKRAALSQKFGL